MKNNTLYIVAAFTALLTGATVVKAGLPDPALVTPLDTFTADVYVFNVTNGTLTDGAFAVSPVTATFGQSNTFNGVGIGGSDVTVASSENVGATLTTDTITISTPNDFIPAGTHFGSGDAVNGIEFDIGYGGNGVAANTLDFTLPLPSNYTASDDFAFNSGDILETPAVTLTNGNQSLSAYDGIYFQQSIAGAGFNSYTLTLSYPTLAVPEPSTDAAMACGVLAFGAVLLRRNRRGAKINIHIASNPA